jgi:hypothetical protein
MTMESPQWFTTMREDGGQRLAIRLRPPSAIGDARNKYGHLFVATQRLRVVCADGLPEPNYNESLHDLDLGIIHQIELGGIVVVVETLSGERSYYAYVSDEAVAKRLVMESASSSRQVEHFEFRGGLDVDWKFYDQYLADVGFSETAL